MEDQKKNIKQQFKQVMNAESVSREFFSISVHFFSCSHPSRSKAVGEDPGFFSGGGGGGLLAGWLACALWGHSRINVACSQSVAI